MTESNLQTILVVDDTPNNIDIVKNVLSELYLVQAAVNGKMALRVLEKKKPDLILLDIMMPEMDGYEVCKRIKENKLTKDIPVIFLTAKTNIESETRGLAVGAVDYIAKPISPPILIERVRNHLELKKSRDALKLQNEILEEKVKERTKQLEELQDVTMAAMGALAESRDPETGNHIHRTQHFVKALAIQLKKQSKFKNFLNPETVTAIFKAAPLHDIGKVGIPDHILLKPGKLTADEFEIIKLHTVYGRDAIISAERTLKIAHNFLNFAKEIVYSHHEKWDGSGYPEGLKGEEIPIPARLMAVADVYDALVSERIYKPAFSHEKSVSIIKEGSGTHFDPDIVNAFLEIIDRFKDIVDEFQD